MGHEFTGIISDVGSDVKTVKKGDKIVCPFTVSWYVYPCSLVLRISSPFLNKFILSTASTWKIQANTNNHHHKQRRMFLLPELLLFPLQQIPPLRLRSPRWRTGGIRPRPSRRQHRLRSTPRHRG